MYYGKTSERKKKFRLITFLVIQAAAILNTLGAVVYPGEWNEVVMFGFFRRRNEPVPRITERFSKESRSHSEGLGVHTFPHIFFFFGHL